MSALPRTAGVASARRHCTMRLSGRPCDEHPCVRQCRRLQCPLAHPQAQAMPLRCSTAVPQLCPPMCGGVTADPCPTLAAATGGLGLLGWLAQSSRANRSSQRSTRSKSQFDRQRPLMGWFESAVGVRITLFRQIEIILRRQHLAQTGSRSRRRRVWICFDQLDVRALARPRSPDVLAARTVAHVASRATPLREAATTAQCPPEPLPFVQRAQARLRQ